MIDVDRGGGVDWIGAARRFFSSCFLVAFVLFFRSLWPHGELSKYPLLPREWQHCTRVERKFLPVSKERHTCPVYPASVPIVSALYEFSLSLLGRCRGVVKGVAWAGGGASTCADRGSACLSAVSRRRINGHRCTRLREQVMRRWWRSFWRQRPTLRRRTG